MHRLLPLLSTVLLSILPACGRGNIALHAAPRPAAQVVVGAKAPLEADAGPAPHETAPLARVAGGGHRHAQQAFHIAPTAAVTAHGDGGFAA